MKNLKVITAVIAILFFAISCESVGLLGQGGVKGSKVKEEILSIATQNNIIIGGLIGGSTGGLIAVLNIIIDDNVVPDLAGIKDSAHYSRPSVDNCKSKMRGIGLLVSTWVGAISCNLKTTPVLLQLGDGDTGSVIQLGPLGL